MQDANGHGFGGANPAAATIPPLPVCGGCLPPACGDCPAALLPLVEATPSLPSRLREGLGEGPSKRRRLPSRAAAGPHPACPASGGGEESRRLLRCPFPIAKAVPSCLWRLPSPNPSRLREGLGEGPSTRRGSAKPHGRWPLPGLPRKRGRRRVAAVAPLSLPRSPRLPWRSPPACGRDWGRVPRRGGRLPARTAAGPHPASPASGGGEKSRRLLCHPLPACGGSPSPSRLREGLGEGPSTRRTFARPHGRRPPPRPPPQAGEGKNRGGCSVMPSPLVKAALSPPSRLRERLGEGPSARRAFAKPHGRRPHPASPTSGEGEELPRLLRHSLPACRG